MLLSPLMIVSVLIWSKVVQDLPSVIANESEALRGPYEEAAHAGIDIHEFGKLPPA